LGIISQGINMHKKSNEYFGLLGFFPLAIVFCFEPFIWNWFNNPLPGFFLILTIFVSAVYIFMEIRKIVKCGLHFSGITLSQTFLIFAATHLILSIIIAIMFSRTGINNMIPEFWDAPYYYLLNPLVYIFDRTACWKSFETKYEMIFSLRSLIGVFNSIFYSILFVSIFKSNKKARLLFVILTLFMIVILYNIYMSLPLREGGARTPPDEIGELFDPAKYTANFSSQSSSAGVVNNSQNGY
jgi:hypothetical protein